MEYISLSVLVTSDLSHGLWRGTGENRTQFTYRTASSRTEPPVHVPNCQKSLSIETTRASSGRQLRLPEVCIAAGVSPVDQRSMLSDYRRLLSDYRRLLSDYRRLLSDGTIAGLDWTTLSWTVGASALRKEQRSDRVIDLTRSLDQVRSLA